MNDYDWTRLCEELENFGLKVILVNKEDYTVLLQLKIENTNEYGTSASRDSR